MRDDRQLLWHFVCNNMRLIASIIGPRGQKCMWCKVDHTLSHANFLQKCRYFQSQVTRWVWLGKNIHFCKSIVLPRITYISFNMHACFMQVSSIMLLKILFPLKIAIPKFLPYFHTLFSVNNIPYREFLQ